jgi:signal transduction histidine kinase
MGHGVSGLTEDLVPQHQRVPSTTDWLVGGGEMGDLIRSKDWSQTSLGPVESWPQSLRSAVSILLPSRAQICLFWGPDLVTLYNDPYRPTLGVKHPAALGLPAREVWHELWDPVLRSLFEGVLNTGEAFWASDHPFFLERHGYPEETYFDVSYDPVRDETGGVGGIFCIVSETTGRVIGERRLRMLRDLARVTSDAQTVIEVFERAGAILEQNPHDIAFACLFDQDGRPVAASRLECTEGWPLAESLDRGGLVLPQEELHAYAPLSGGVWTEPARAALILPIQVPAQPPYGYLVAGFSPRLEQNDAYQDFLRLVASTIASAVAAVEALEQQRARAEALAEIDRAKTVFFSNVSHEFRTPLTLMLGPLEDLLAGKAKTPLAPEHRETLELVRRNSRRLHKLVNTLLEFSRIEAGRANAQYEPVDLAKFTSELASNFHSACEKAGLNLRIDCAPLREPVWVDPGMWERIVLNLVSNALKFTFDGEIALTLSEVGGHVEFQVSDTGIGISAEDLPHLFERFHRVEGVRARIHEGSGIGLALVHELAQLHGGEVHVASEPGRGTTFTVTIPFGSAHLPSERLKTGGDAPFRATQVSSYMEEALGWLQGGVTDARPTPVPGSLVLIRSGERILVVDDNTDMRDYITRHLGARWNVTAVGDGFAALEALRRERFDLVVSDIMMPGMDGLALLREIKSDAAWPGTPVILLSARAGEEARIEGLGAGADDYIVKPFSSAQLLAQVNAQLTIQRTRQESARERERLLALERAAKREAEAANRAKDEFLAMLSHELRNPLAPIVSSLRLMRLTGPPSPALDILERQAGHLTRLVDDLLDVSRITRHKIELRMRRAELAEVVDKALEIANPLLEERNHRIDTREVPRQGLSVDADPERLAQIIFNLLSNAAKYSERNSTITLRAWAEKDRVRLSVKDEGVGIAPEMAHLIFELFAQQPQTLERSQGGLGLGLAIVRHLTQLHGGTVSVVSEGVGTGSEFTLELPAARLESAPPEPAPAHKGPARSRGVAVRRILVVDDNWDAAAALAELLTYLGHVVEVAHDGASCLTRFRTFRPDVAFIDIGLPGIDGYEVARQLRLSEAAERTLLVAVTGYGLEADRKRSADAGFHHHLVKPADMAGLEQLLAQA